MTQIRKEIPLGELDRKRSVFEQYSKETLTEWGFDPTKGIVIWDSLTNNCWVLLQDREEVNNGTEIPPTGGD